MPEGNPNIKDDESIQRILKEAERIAVIGMKPEGPALEVPQYLEEAGYEVVPVNPQYREVDDKTTYDRVNLVPDEVDVVCLFRRSEAIPEHVDEILVMDPLPDAAWFQLNIRNREAAEELAEFGLDVVQDACMKVEHKRLEKKD